ncbi:MAG: type II toxin-antitoxin system YafQ family toxin [Bacteroidales bacterium]|nr:type II toxin-antitoxin system YafQ family toxin [Bacteroidales bacterium]
MILYELTRTTQFKRDLKRITKRNYDLSKLEKFLLQLVSGQALPEKYKVHPLSNNFKGYFDCHIEPDWIILYKKDETNKLITLVRTGTHSDIFG